MVQTKTTIQVQIGNRSYPITVAAEEQESVVKAAEKINNQMKELEAAYKVKDQQDLLARSKRHSNTSQADLWDTHQEQKQPLALLALG